MSEPDYIDDKHEARIAELEASVAYHVEQFNIVSGIAEEQRARRLELEEELAASNEAFLHRDPPQIRYIERKVIPPARIVDRHIVVERVKWMDRPARLFGRLGDWIDRRLFGRDTRDGPLLQRRGPI